MSKARILIAPPGSITDADRDKLEQHDIIVITGDPDAIKELSPASIGGALTADDLTLAALEAIEKEPGFRAKEAFFNALNRRVKNLAEKREREDATPQKPKRGPDGKFVKRQRIEADA